MPNEKVTVGEYLERWIAGRRGLRPATLESYRGHVTKYLIPYLGAILLRDLEDHHISAMFTALEENNEAIRRSLETAPRRRRGTYLKANEVAEGARRERRKVIDPASQQRLRATLRKALNDAIKKRLIAGPNPASMVELESGESPPPGAVDRGDRSPLARDGRRARIRDGVAAGAVRRVPGRCGRRSALQPVLDGQSDRNEARRAVRAALAGRRHRHRRMEIKVQLSAGGEEGPTKTKAGRRSVPLDAGLLAMLKGAPDAAGEGPDALGGAVGGQRPGVRQGERRAAGARLREQHVPEDQPGS
jgi:hypothetical protein